jgi:hypothetical protein
LSSLDPSSDNASPRRDPEAWLPPSILEDILYNHAPKLSQKDINLLADLINGFENKLNLKMERSKEEVAPITTPTLSSESNQKAPSDSPNPTSNVLSSETKTESDSERLKKLLEMVKGLEVRLLNIPTPPKSLVTTETASALQLIETAIERDK